MQKQRKQSKAKHNNATPCKNKQDVAKTTKITQKKETLQNWTKPSKPKTRNKKGNQTKQL